jgi:type IV secretion system protein VirD4
VTPTKFLIGQITVVLAVTVGGLWFATEWVAWRLGYQPQLGLPWFMLAGQPIYHPWCLFVWWYAYDAYAPKLFNEAGAIAATSGFAGCAVAIVGSLWRARQNQHVTTYGSSRWATPREIDRAGLRRPSGVFLGQLNGNYLRHDGPEHVMAFAPTRSGKGVVLDAERRHSRHQGRELAAHSGLAQPLLALPSVQSHRCAQRPLQPAARSAQGARRSSRCAEHRRHPGRS